MGCFKMSIMVPRCYYINKSKYSVYINNENIIIANIVEQQSYMLKQAQILFFFMVKCIKAVFLIV